MKLINKDAIEAIIIESIQSEERYAEEYIQDLDNQEAAEGCFYAIEVLKRLANRINNEL